MVVLTGTVPDGGTIPLPHYADATEALESDCKSIVTAGTTICPTCTIFCYTSGRVVTVGVGGGGSNMGAANDMIIASRATAAVGTVRHTFGELKERYRSR